MDKPVFKIAFVAGKLGDVDGVSLEVEKWIHILKDQGHEIYAVSGKFSSPVEGVSDDNMLTIPDIRFDSDIQREYEQMVFPYLSKYQTYLTAQKLRDVVEEMSHKGSYISDIIFEFIQKNSIDVLVAQNTNAMPMTLLGGLAVYKLCTEKRIATIFHHHDFWWERSRFCNSAIESLLSETMPPRAPGLEHVVLSNYASHILRSIKRVQPRIIPNCEDFDSPVVLDDYNSDFRESLGFSAEDILVVQPTRIVPRKRIEDSVRLLSRLGKKYPEFNSRIKLVISLYQGDEPNLGYVEMIKSLAESEKVPLYFIADRVGSVRGSDSEGRKIYTNRDVLANADLATYLPIWEGFGNAFLEAVAARVPVVISTYLVYKTDIRVHDFDNIEIPDNYDSSGALVIPDEPLTQIYNILTDRMLKKAVVEKNFRVGREYFGMNVLKDCLSELFGEYSFEILASRKRIADSRIGFSV